MLVEKSGRGGYAHEFPPRLPRWYFSFIGVLLAEVLWQGMSVFGILFWNFSNLSTRKNMHFKNFHVFITFWQKIGIFFLMCILAGYHCTSIISWQYFQNDILLILTWVLNQGPWYFKADALSTRPTDHGTIVENKHRNMFGFGRFWIMLAGDLGICRQALYPQGQLSMEKLMKVPLIKLRHLFIHSDWKMKNFSIHA